MKTLYIIIESLVYVTIFLIVPFYISIRIMNHSRVSQKRKVSEGDQIVGVFLILGSVTFPVAFLRSLMVERSPFSLLLFSINGIMTALLSTSGIGLYKGAIWGKIGGLILAVIGCICTIFVTISMAIGIVRHDYKIISTELVLGLVSVLLTGLLLLVIIRTVKRLCTFN